MNIKYFIITYGCQMNISDSERIATQLERSGYKPAKTLAKADLVVVNICSIRQSAVHRAFDRIYKLSKKKIIVAGCVLPEDKKKKKAGCQKYRRLAPGRLFLGGSFTPK